MQQRCLSIQMLAPAFLGDADQKGTWRTPPFKALLREWPEPAGKHDRLCASKVRLENPLP